MTPALTCILPAHHWWLTPTMHLALRPGPELIACDSMVSPSSCEPPSVCEMQLVSSLRVDEEFLEEEPAGPWVWAPHPHAWLPYIPSPPHPHPFPSLQLPKASRLFLRFGSRREFPLTLYFLLPLLFARNHLGCCVYFFLVPREITQNV